MFLAFRYARIINSIHSSFSYPAFNTPVIFISPVKNLTGNPFIRPFRHHVLHAYMSTYLMQEYALRFASTYIFPEQMRLAFVYHAFGGTINLTFILRTVFHKVSYGFMHLHFVTFSAYCSVSFKLIYNALASDTFSGFSAF